MILHHGLTLQAAKDAHADGGHVDWTDEAENPQGLLASDSLQGKDGLPRSGNRPWPCTNTHLPSLTRTAAPTCMRMCTGVYRAMWEAQLRGLDLDTKEKQSKGEAAGADVV